MKVLEINTGELFFLVLILRLGKLFPKKIENIKQHERMKLTGLQFI